MSKETCLRMLGIFMMLSLALSAFLILPESASAEGNVNLKVLVKNQKEENLNSAMVYALNVHTGTEYDLSWSESVGWFEADVPPGTYQVFASSKGYTSPQEPQMVYGISEENEDGPQIIIKLTRIGNRADVRIRVTDGPVPDDDSVADAKVHVFDGNGGHLMEMTTPMGWANFSAPTGNLHILIASEGMLVYSMNVMVNDTHPYTKTVQLMDEPAGDVGSYRAMGIVKSGKVFVPGLEIHIWDQNNGHMVPVDTAEDGALSIPLYNSTFHILVEAEGYEPYWKASIDLNAGDHYYRPVNNTFSMKAIETMESKMTTIDLAAEDGIINPTITTVWTMDANSRIFGTPNPFGNPRMQVSGVFPSSDWLVLEASEVGAAETVLNEFGPAWMDTEYFFKVNDEAYQADLEAYDVTIEGLLGGITEAGVNPVATMSTDYTTELGYESDDDLRVEIYSLMDGETIEVILPDDYEILGEFDEDEAMNPDGNTSRLMVYQPIEFNAKKEVRPVADLDFISSMDSYKVDDKKYIVDLFKNLTLSAKGSSDPVGDIVEYHWMNIPSSARIWIEDENLSISEITNDLDEIVIQFTQNSNQFINITLQVIDSSGRNSEKVDYVNIMPDSAAPSFVNYTLSEEVETDGEVTEFELMSEPYTIDEDKLIEFNVTAEDNGEVVDYIWTFSDDSGSLNGQVVTKRFADPGNYNISLVLVDAVGNRKEVANKSITVNDITDPMAVIKPFDEGDEGIKIGDDIEFNGTQSYDPRSVEDMTEGLEFEWFFYEEGDEYKNQTSMGTGDVIAFAFDEPGVFRINLTVTDSAGNMGWTERNIVINGVDLTVENMEFIKPDVNDLMEGESIKMSILIRNSGKVDMNESVDVIFYKNDEKKIKSHTIDGGLDAGEIYYWNFTFTPTYSGEIEFKVVVDPDNMIKEDTDDNNEIIRPATIKTEDSKLLDYWYVIPIIILILIAVYVVYMKYTRNMWGYEPIVEWWNKRNG